MSEQRAPAPAREPVELAEVRAHRAAALPTMADVRALLEFGAVLVKSGLLPETVKTAEAAAVILLKGQELGIPPMAAMEGIAVVKGKAAVGAHLMLGLVKRAYGPNVIWFEESTERTCTLAYRLPGSQRVLTNTYDWDDATKANLVGGNTWRQHPKAMLRARCISATCKMAFPEVVGGLYVAGEIDGTREVVTDDGDVIVDVTAASAAPRPEPPPEAEPPRRQPRPQARAGEPTEPPADRSWIDDPVPDGAGLTHRQLRRIGALVNDLPLDKPRSLDALRRVLRDVLGTADDAEPSRKALTEQAAGEVVFRLQVLGDELRESPDPNAGAVRPLVEAEAVEPEDAAGDRWTR